MRKLDPLQRLNPRPLPAREERGRLFACPVQRKDRRALEGRNQTRAGRVAQVVLQITKPKTAGPVTPPDHPRVFEHAQVTVADLRDAAIDARAEHIHRDGQRLQSLRGLAAQNPRLPVERNVFDIADPDPGLIQTELQGVIRKPAVMLDARETLLLGGGDQLAVTDQRRDYQSGTERRRPKGSADLIYAQASLN